MGAVRCIFSESERCFLKVGGQYQLNLEGTRKFQASPLRYCLQNDVLYLPMGFSKEDYAYTKRICWARLRIDVINELEFSFGFDEPVPDEYTLVRLADEGVGLGACYLKRHQELDGKRESVSQFCSSEIIKGIRDNPEVLDTISKHDFEALCAELFVSRGFEVDLFRSSKDNGIDFLAFKNEDTDPILLAVQCKHPEHERKGGKGARTLPVATVREIYGVAKAYGLSGGVAITSAEYSPAAKRFAELQPTEISVHNRDDVMAWVSEYRWNEDEKS